MGYYIGCDLGGTNMRAAIVDSDNGTLFGMQSIPTEANKGHDHVLDRMATFFDKIISDTAFTSNDIRGIGFGLPGIIDMKAGKSIFMTNLPDHWIDVPVCDIISKKTGIPSFVLNDVRAITWGESQFGAGRGCQSMVCYAIGTGIGGGVIINGKLILGLSGSAGELGHQCVEPNGKHCNCGSYGCLETYASGPAIRSAGIKAVCHGGTTIIGKMVDYDLNKITPRTIAEAAQAGDQIAKEIFEKAGFYLGIAISNTIMTLQPEMIVVTGGVAAAGDLLFDPIRRTVQERCKGADPSNVKIVPGQLNDNAGIIGTSMWAMDNINNKDTF